MKETVTIDALEYENLLKESLQLESLYRHGVEEWQGYEKAMDNI